MAKATRKRKIPAISIEPEISSERSWTFFTNHAHVFFLLTSNPDILLRDIAKQVGITERAVQKILTELINEGFVEVERRGRTNHYKLFLNHPLRHPIERHRTIADMVKALGLEQAKERN